MSQSPSALIALLGLMMISLAGAVLILGSSGPLDRASKATLIVACPDGYGTGWWVGENTVVTAAHVVSCQSPVLIRGAYRSNATVIYSNSSLDIALLRPQKRPPFKPPTLEIADRAWVGEHVFVIGYPIMVYEELKDLSEMSIAPRVSEGMIAWINPETRIIEVTATTDQGNSGGPIIDETGAVVGEISYARKGAVDSAIYGTSLVGLREALDQAGITYGVHHWWESKAVAALLITALSPLVWIIAGEVLWRR